MAGFLVETAKAIQGLQCQLLGANEYIVGSIGRYAGPVRERALDGINANRRLLGCNPAEDVTEPPPAFEGGQCVCELYQVDYVVEGTQDANGAPRTFTGTRKVRGPISGGSVSENGGSFLMNAGSNFVLVGASNPPCSSVAPRLLVAMGTPISDASLTTFSVTSLSSNPGDCGSLPPVYPPPTNTDFDIDVTYQPDFGPEVTVPINIDFSPTTIDFSGNVNFPFNFDFGGFEYSGNLSFSPNAEVNFNPVINLPRGTGQPTDTLPPQVDPEPVPPAPPDQLIIGVAVQSVISGEQQLTTILTQGMPNIFAPRAGSIKFAYSLGISTFWSNDIDVKGPNVFIPCPFSQGADAVVVTPAPGVAVTWVPIYGFPLATVEDVNRAAATT